MSKKVLKLAGRQPMMLALIMATITIALLFSNSGPVPTASRAQTSSTNPPPYIEATNCVEHGPYYGEWIFSCPKQTNIYSITPNSFSCVDVGQAPPMPTNIATPKFSAGYKRRSISWDCTNAPSVTNVSITKTPSGHIVWVPDIPKKFTNAMTFSSTAWMNVSSSDPGCENVSEELGTVTWNVVSTNCLTLDKFLGTNGWQVKDIDLNDDGTPSFPTFYKGYTVDYMASVSAHCHCGCETNVNSGQKKLAIVFDDPSSDWFTGYKLGSMPFDLTPITVADALGALVGKGLEIINPCSMDQKSFNDIITKAAASVPTSADAGSWVGGKDPCGN